MEITIDDKAEFSTMIADLIIRLSMLDDFILKIWTPNHELPFIIDYKVYDIHFMHEGITVMNENAISYIPFDSITNILVITGEDKLRWERIR